MCQPQHASIIHVELRHLQLLHALPREQDSCTSPPQKKPKHNADDEDEEKDASNGTEQQSKLWYRGEADVVRHICRAGYMYTDSCSNVWRPEC